MLRNTKLCDMTLRLPTRVMPKRYKQVTISLPDAAFHKRAVEHARKKHGMSFSTFVAKLIQEDLDRHDRQSTFGTLEDKINRLEEALLRLATK